MKIFSKYAVILMVMMSLFGQHIVSAQVSTPTYPTVGFYLPVKRTDLVDTVSFDVKRSEATYSDEVKITHEVNPSSAASDYAVNFEWSGYVNERMSGVPDGVKIATATVSIDQADPNVEQRTIPGATITIKIEWPFRGDDPSSLSHLK